MRGAHHLGVLRELLEHLGEGVGGETLSVSAGLTLTAGIRHGEGRRERWLEALRRAGAVRVEHNRDVAYDAVGNGLRRWKRGGGSRHRSGGERRRVGGVGCDQIAGTATRAGTHGVRVRYDVEGRNSSRVGYVGRVTGETRVTRISGVTRISRVAWETVSTRVTWES